jgi:zinc protease
MSNIRRYAAALVVSIPAVGFAQGAPAAATPAVAPPLTTVLPTDSKVKIGTLSNGLRYYIRQNSKPEKRAELRLVVNAGSILEADNQLGYAHIIEHTAFNGTTHFAKNDLIKYLQSIGVRFGADLNAYTSFDETVYILPVPTDTARIVEQAFTILEDWAHGQTFDSTEVMNERGVVREEWRGRKGAGDRMLQKWLPIAFKGSRYATRLPIGTEPSIMGARPSKLKPFYNEWYRPDLQAVIAVGDFNPADIEAQIKKHFSGISAKPNAPKRPVYDVPSNTTPLVAITSDKEATSSSINLTFKLPAVPTKTVGDYRRDLIQDLYLQMLNARFAEIVQKPDAPFLAAGASKSSFFARTTDGFTLAANVKDGGVERGLEALLTEARRVDQFGFLQSELDRAKQDLLRGYEQAYAERDKTPSVSIAEEYIRNYLEAETIPGIAYENMLAQTLTPAITLADVNKLASNWITDQNRVIIAQTPLKEGVPVPTEGGLLAVFDRAAKAPIIAYTESLSGSALIDKVPASGKIVSSSPIASIGATEWKLSNGARVIVKPTDFKADEILFGAYSRGGTSLAADADVMSARLASQIVGLGGAGNFNRIDLAKKLSGKDLAVAPAIGETTEGFNGHTSVKDLETLFQLVYLDFTSPRLDTTAFNAFRAQIGPFLANRGASPDAVFQDTVQVTMAQHSFRARPITPAVFAEVNPDKAMAFYKDRFADASDFTFVFVGNVDTMALKPLVERYLASLPSTGRKETFRDTGITPPKGVVQRVVNKGTEPKANTIIEFTGPCLSTPQSRFMFRALTILVQMRLNETLREKLGGTYSPNVGGGCSREPRPEYVIQVVFGSSPENVDLLSKATFALIDSLKSNPPSQADVDKVKEQILRAREVETRQNAYWVGNIIARDEAGEDLGGLTSQYDEMVKQLTAAQLQQTAKQYFDTSNYAKFVLLPAGKTAQ